MGSVATQQTQINAVRSSSSLHRLQCLSGVDMELQARGDLDQLKGLCLVVWEVTQQSTIQRRPLFNALNGATCCGKPGHEGRTEQHNRERPTEHEGTAEQQTQPSTSPTLRWTGTTRHGNVVPADALPAGATGGDSSDQNDVAVL